MAANRRFLGLFSISALLHVLVLIAWEAPLRLSAPAGPEALRVTLLAPARPQPAPRTPPRPHTSPLAEPKHDPGPAAESETAPDTGPEQASVTIRGRRLEAALHSALRPHFYYPPIARQQGWEGEVRLALRIEANGYLTRARIVRSSGYGILDRAALRSVERLQRLPDVTTLLNGQSQDLVLPVQYQLASIF